MTTKNKESIFLKIGRWLTESFCKHEFVRSYNAPTNLYYYECSKCDKQITTESYKKNYC